MIMRPVNLEASFDFILTHFPKQWQSYIDLNKLDPIDKFLEAEIIASKEWHPSPENIFQFLELTKPANLKAAWLGLILRNQAFTR